MLRPWISSFNEYQIFCDEKTIRKKDRYRILLQVLNNANIASEIISIQALPSYEVVLIQLTDFLLGMVSSCMNETVQPISVKDNLIKYLEQKLGISCLRPTYKSEQKFNIFKINLQGGW